MSSKDRIPTHGLDQYVTSVISKIGADNVTDRVVHEIYAYIKNNKLGPDEKLPPERYFIDLLKVSRSSLREAMRVLATLGLVEVRRGDGTYVTTPTVFWKLSAQIIFDATEENALRNLLETRFGIETAMIEAVIARASESDFNRIEKLLDDHDHALSNNKEFAWKPLEFELALMEIAENSWLYEIERMLATIWQSLSIKLKSDVGRYIEWHQEHRAILAALRGRNNNEAQRLLRIHLNFSRFEHDLHKLRKDN